MASKASCSSYFLHDPFLVVGLQLSSIWLGIKPLWSTLLFNIQWLVGDGSSIHFWKDNWLGEIKAQSCNMISITWVFLMIRSVLSSLTVHDR